MKHRAFTLIEMLVAVSIVLVLMSAMITVTGHLKNEARKRLTASALGVIATSLEQYYENTSPKQFPLEVSNQSDFEIALFGNPPSDTVGIVGTGFPIPDADPLTDDPGTVFWRSASLYYFLNRTTQSRAIVESLSNQMLSNKYDGIATLIRIPNSSATATDCIRFVDAWGNTCNYRYLPGDAFPVVISAGPDKIFGTEDDVVGQ